MAHGKFEFNGTGLGFFWLALWTWFLTVLTLGLYFPWAVSAKQRWIAGNTLIDGKKLCFEGTGAGFFLTWLLILVLSAITFGLYLPWAVCRIQRWITNNTRFE